MVEIKKIKIIKINDPFSLACGDLIFHKRRKCDLTILGFDSIYSGYRVRFHDNYMIGNLPIESVLKYCYHLS